MENQIKNILLDYAAHLSVSCEWINSFALFSKSSLGGVSAQDKNSLEGKRFLMRRSHLSAYKQKHLSNGLANMLMVVDKLLHNRARLLIINHSDNGLQVHLQPRPKNCKHNVPYLLQGGWMGGACSNWSRLSKVAWNSHKLVNLTRTLDSTMPLDSWLLEVYSTFRGLHLAPKKGSGWRLAYKYKPDCVFLINPSSATVRECKALSVPLCICSSTLSPKISGCYLESNQESSYLIYLMLTLMAAGRRLCITS